MIVPRTSLLLPALLAAVACGPTGAPERNDQADNEMLETVDIPQTVTAVAPGTTPMAQRVAVLGLLNKRNGLSRDLTLRPGQAVRVGDVIVRLRACETTAPWEVQSLTGAFVQLDVRNTQGQFQRVFSGWLYRESPSLNVVEHPVYDVWPKSCAMTHPGGGEPAGRPASNRSSAPNSAAPAPAPAPSPPAPDEAPAPSAEANSAR
jgi:hypothetical protein